MITRIERADATLTPLPGRDWFSYLRPDMGVSRQVSAGLSIFPAGSAPEGHVHAAEEEAIFVVSGHGQLVTPDGTAELAPGVFVLVSPATPHATVAGDEGLTLWCVFSPPVVPGSYEAPR